MHLFFAILALLIALTLVLGVLLGKVIYQNRYRRKYRQEHMNSLNCHFLPSNGTEFYAVTIATSLTPQANRLIQSLSTSGIDLHLLALGCKWQGFGNKVFWLREYFKVLEASYSSDPIVLFVDAYDVVNLASAEEILAKFKSLDTRVVVGAEKSCWPRAEDACRFPNQNEKYKFLNAGCVMGYRSDLAKIINTFALTPADSEQGAWTKYFLENPGSIKIDYGGSLFFNLYDAEMDDYVPPTKPGDRWFLSYSGEFPCLIHGNGPSGLLLDKVHPPIAVT